MIRGKSAGADFFSIDVQRFFSEMRMESARRFLRFVFYWGWWCSGLGGGCASLRGGPGFGLFIYG